MQVVTKGFTSPYLEKQSLDESITVDEIIELHDELKRFDGNFRRVFAPSIDQNHLF